MRTSIIRGKQANKPIKAGTLGPLTQAALDWLVLKHRAHIEACDEEMWCAAIDRHGLTVRQYRQVADSTWAAQSLTHTVAFALSRPAPAPGMLGRCFASDVAQSNRRAAAIALAVAESHLTLFEVMDRSDGHVQIADLFRSGNRFDVMVGEGVKGLKRGDLALGRRIAVDGRNSFHGPTMLLTDRTARFAFNVVADEVGCAAASGRPSAATALDVDSDRLTDLAGGIMLSYAGQKRLATARASFDAAREKARASLDLRSGLGLAQPTGSS